MGSYVALAYFVLASLALSLTLSRLGASVDVAFTAGLAGAMGVPWALEGVRRRYSAVSLE